MTSISFASGVVTYHSFRVFEAGAQHPCYTIGAYGKNELDGLQNAISLNRTALEDFGGADNLDYQHHSSWRKDNG
ncbi:hypothetical protein EVB81_249 [Rhizobium phage RHph_I46]|uniref:Uncharacterized protein n=1 Tax=Rhizobium phage RHph_I1_9 TaxID=2509729 RepID=A0A7S5RIQ3_9CAUD|nr:hypothetical protein PP936_gp247 [Rhizobium phage RHph_I1_9]QIG69818.1 hypothetical protein EVB81_249 [Rhizobium phage RHph_I46]QIG71099.1 hypothetical protein EVB92_249 [Rhizobium phage RHph_I9]QIG73684.1 hypothetical protein EVC04_247 [Rhizobium phage RHph_I1_9]QIG76438.1 hypothetical protein EVC25_249 [Rhizobium phage RHph_I34]